MATVKKAAQPAQEVKKGDVWKVPFDNLHLVEGLNIRTDYGDIEELAASILANGVKVALQGYRDGEQFYVVDGHRRYTALKLLADRGHKLIVPKCQNLIFLLLTKRPQNITKYIPFNWMYSPPENVMFGTSISNQETADELLPEFSKVIGKKFLSIEPQVGIIDLTKEYPVGKGQVAFGLLVDWVICGGESGDKRRPFDVGFAYQLKRQCKDADIPFFMKQIDKVIPIPADLMIREFPAYHNQ